MNNKTPSFSISSLYGGAWVSGSLTTVLTGWVLQKSMKSTVYPNDTK